jgi:hypothetical protein
MPRMKKNVDDIAAELCGAENEYAIKMGELFDHPKMIEYMYNKPIREYTCLINTVIKYDTIIRRVSLSDMQLSKIDSIFGFIEESENTYINMYETYKQFRNADIRLFKEPYKMTKCDKTVLKIFRDLDDELELKNDNTSRPFQYISNISIGDYVYNFFGLYADEHRMRLFVITFDDATHFNRKSDEFSIIHTNDIMMQFQLHCMDIHLLRLNKNSDIREETMTFLNSIIKTNTYIVMNCIKPIKKLFDTSDNSQVINFCKTYSGHHMIYLRQKPTEYDPNDIQVELIKYVEPIHQLKEDNEPSDIGFDISEETYKAIRKRKIFYTKN